VGGGGVCCECDDEPSGFIKCGLYSILPEDLLATQEGLSSAELHSQSPTKGLWIDYVRDTVTAYYKNCTKHTDLLSTRSPFATLLSRRAQSGR